MELRDNRPLGGSAGERSRRHDASRCRRFHGGDVERSTRRQLLLMRLRTCCKRAERSRARCLSRTQPSCANANEEGSAHESQALQCWYCRRRGAVEPGFDGADIVTVSSVGWCIRMAAIMRFVMCSPWSSSAVPLTEPNVCLGGVEAGAAAGRPVSGLSRGLRIHVTLVCYGSGVATPSLGLTSVVSVFQKNRPFIRVVPSRQRHRRAIGAAVGSRPGSPIGHLRQIM